MINPAILQPQYYKQLIISLFFSKNKLSALNNPYNIIIMLDTNNLPPHAHYLMNNPHYLTLYFYFSPSSAATQHLLPTATPFAWFGLGLSFHYLLHNFLSYVLLVPN